MPSEHGAGQRGAEADGGGAGPRVDARQVARGVDRVRRQPVDLGLVEEQEEGAEASDPVVVVGPVQPRLALPGRGQALKPGLGALAQLVESAELDRVRRAGLRAGRLLARAEAVVAERALPDAAVVLALVEHPERARRHAVAAAVADVLLDDDGAELRAEQRARGADLEARGVRAVLADVGGHEPAHVAEVVRELAAGGVVDQRVLDPVLDPDGLALLDERDVAPGVRAEPARVVHRPARVHEPVLGHMVPLLAGDLARLAADADARVGEEADARPRLAAVGADLKRSAAHPPALRRYSSTNASSAGPRGRRPGRTSQVELLNSEMATFESSTIGSRSLAESPVASPLPPQWYGRPT